MTSDWITPDWPVPVRVRALSTTRLGGVSTTPFDSLNLGDHVGDASQDVMANRQRLRELAALPGEPLWLKQVHGTQVAEFDSATATPPEADAVVAREPGQVCAIMTADCLPVLFASADGGCVAAAHAGWRGLAAGVLPATLQTMRTEASQCLAWLGPAIGPDAFEVGGEVRETFLRQDPGAEVCFQPHGERWLADIYGLARRQLQALGLESIHGGGLCTYGDAARFFSYRRDAVCGRMASLIWLE